MNADFKIGDLIKRIKCFATSVPEGSLAIALEDKPDNTYSVCVFNLLTKTKQIWALLYTEKLE